jgi:chaperonin GroES
VRITGAYSPGDCRASTRIHAPSSFAASPPAAFDPALLDSTGRSPYVPAGPLALNRRECQIAFPKSPAQSQFSNAFSAREEAMAKTKFRPLHDRVVVRRIDAEAKTKGGIIIPDTAKEKPQEGEIIAVGPGGRDEAGKLVKPDVKVGDRVLFGKWSGTEVKLDGEELLIMKESDIMGVIG